MDTREYNNIINKMKDVIASCKELCSEIETVNGDITKWSLQKYGLMRSMAMNLQAKTDKILSTELYHIIGMAQMTVTQSTHFVKLTKELTNCRRIVKKCAALPELKIYPIDLQAIGQYECKELGLTLTK